MTPFNRGPRVGVVGFVSIHGIFLICFHDIYFLSVQERNREHAKRSRIRKKFMLECLQEQLLAMRKQNMALRQVSRPYHCNSVCAF